MSKFGPSIVGYMSKRSVSGPYFALVSLSQTNRKTGYLRSEDKEISSDEMSKFGPIIVGYMSKRSVSGLYFALVSLRLTSR